MALLSRYSCPLVCVLLLVAAAIPSSLAAGAWQYTVTDLGTLGGSYVRPTAMNNKGQVVGTSQTTAGDRHAFLFSDGAMVDLGTHSGRPNSTANDINDQGHIVGFSSLTTGSPRAFLNIDGEMIDLGHPDFYSDSVATGINNNDTIVAFAHPYSPSTRGDGFIYEDGGWIELRRPVGYYLDSIPHRINSNGLIGGYVLTAGAYDHAALYADDQWTDLGTLGGSYSRSRIEGINDAGQAVGWTVELSGLDHAFLYEDGVMHDLGVPEGWLDSSGRDINEKGQIVTRNRLLNSSEHHAFLYFEGEWTDLNTCVNPDSGWLLEEPIAINDNGWIAGLGKRDGVTRAFLLKPVPEPTTLALAVFALMGVACCRRRR